LPLASLPSASEIAAFRLIFPRHRGC
jgi:hypothetical protein